MRREPAGHPGRARGRFVRVLVLVLLLGAAGLGARSFWEDVVVPTFAPVARDYLAFRRVARYQGVLRRAAAESGIDPLLLAAIMAVESGGRVGARSEKNALGLFQLSMATAAWRAQELGLEAPTEEELLSDPDLNARLGANNLAWLLDTFDGDVERALIAYNVGTGRLARMVRAAGGWEAWRRERKEAGDSRLLAYAAKVLDYRDRFRERGLFDDEGRAKTTR